MNRRRQFRASQAAQLFACYGSDLLQKRVRAASPRRETEAATAGRWCHAQAAQYLITAHDALFAGTGLDRPGSFKPTGFHLWMVAFYCSAVLELSSVDMALEVEAEFEHLFKVKPYTAYDPVTGERYEADEIGVSGHVDAFALTADETEAVGFDLKTGSDPVDEAADNAQVFFYICLLKLAYPKLRKVTFYIVQPTNDPDERERISEACIEGERLDSAVAYLEGQLLLACDNPHELNSDGWKQCRYCDAALVCPALQSDIDAMKLKLTPEEFAAIKLRPELDDLARIKIAAKKLTPIFDEASDELKARLETDGAAEVDGVRFFLEERPGKRKVTDNAKATERLAFLPDAQFHTAYEFKPAAIEELLATHYGLPKTSKKGDSGKSKYTELLGDITEQPVNKVLKIA